MFCPALEILQDASYISDNHPAYTREPTGLI
jgi:hypothetical protein